MEFRLLGPLDVVEHGGSLALGGVKQRSLLAVLLLNANQLVSADRLIDELWGQTPPRTASKGVQVYVSRLRKELGGEGRLATQAPGYILRVDPSELDLARFEQLLDEASRVDPAAAAQKLRRALSLWRGPALADLAYEPFAQSQIGRLEELRWAALEQRIDADLADGRHAELVGELEALITEQPLREHLRYQLMLALYRSARQAEALDAYRKASRELSEEVGLEPSEELKGLETAILRHDPVLELPDEATPAPPLAPEAPERSLLVAPRALEGSEALLRIAQPLAASPPARELIIAGVVETADLSAATATLAERREQLMAEGLAARTAAFSSPTPGNDIVRLASQESVDLLVMDTGRSPLSGEASVVLDQAPCDVAMLVEASGSIREGAVIVPFGAGWHDWAALELGAWVARATDAQLRLIGATSERRDDGRDASRLLADASLIVQQQAGVVAEPLLASPGRSGVMALAEGAGLLVVGLSERWREEGLGRARTELVETPPAPTLLVRRGPRPGGLAPAQTRTRFGWSLTADAP
jgi:DNA-binding SARP family transcriptional activator